MHYLGDNGNMATLPEKEAGLELDTTAMHKVSKVKPTTLQELIGLGKDYIGYSGKGLQLFVAEQQDREREERKSERDARREEAERKTRKDEAEREARREEADREIRREEAVREENERKWKAEMDAKQEEVRMRLQHEQRMARIQKLERGQELSVPFYADEEKSEEIMSTSRRLPLKIPMPKYDDNVHVHVAVIAQIMQSLHTNLNSVVNNRNVEKRKTIEKEKMMFFIYSKNSTPSQVHRKPLRLSPAQSNISSAT